MDGVFLLDKPVGITSFSAVNKARHILNLRKTGHTGTLDPNASGLLIVLCDKYAKLAPYCVTGPKRYEATVRLGIRTDSGDITGNVVEEKEVHNHTQEVLDALKKRFLGEIEQIPPMYSALKVNGQKLVDLARIGKKVERKPRTVTIYELEVKQVSLDTYTLSASVSSGTYIRTLSEDYFFALGECSTLTALRRTCIASLTVNEATLLSDLYQDTVNWISPKRIIDPMWKLMDCEEHEDDILHGRTFDMDIPYESLIFTKGETLLAAYTKREDLHYHCQRGLL